MIPAKVRSLAAPALAVLVSCAPHISQFSPIAYEQATELKVDAQALMARAAEPYPKHEDDVIALTLRLEKAYEFARGRPRNEISARQWAILADSTRNLLGGFLARWKRETSLSPAFISEARQLVAQAFDTIIGLESGKLKEKDVR